MSRKVQRKVCTPKPEALVNFRDRKDASWDRLHAITSKVNCYDHPGIAATLDDIEELHWLAVFLWNRSIEEEEEKEAARPE